MKQEYLTKLVLAVRACASSFRNFMFERKRHAIIPRARTMSTLDKPLQKEQDLDIYWNDEMANILETWGENNAWKEIQFLIVNCNGRILDIACGTGKTIDILAKYSSCEIYGCDISDFLIQKAINRGISEKHLKVCDATRTGYENNFFNFSYSIGSLEHFTEEGIEQFIIETSRITKISSFHMIPVSRSGANEGWIKTLQSFHNNSSDWWMEKFKSVYGKIYLLDSSWEDDISVGKWFVCIKED
jgi:ubiquinone/menaquinone biosynthesis C-methylase UbiE